HALKIRLFPDHGGSEVFRTDLFPSPGVVQPGPGSQCRRDRFQATKARSLPSSDASGSGDPGSLPSGHGPYGGLPSRSEEESRCKTRLDRARSHHRLENNPTSPRSHRFPFQKEPDHTPWKEEEISLPFSCF